MNPITSKYVTHKNLDVVLSDIIDFVGACYDAHEENLTKVKNELKTEMKSGLNNLRTELKADINKVRLDLQNYQENTSLAFIEIRSDIKEIKSDQKNFRKELKSMKNSIRGLQGSQKEMQTLLIDIKKTTEELKAMNNNILGLITYQENRLREMEKKAHTHSTDML